MRLALLAGLSGVLFAVALPAHADSSVERRLDERGIQYEKDEDGDYRVLYSYDGEGRTQLAFVSGGTESIRGYVIREVFAPAGHVRDDRISGARALELLANSRTRKLGAWELQGDMLIYVIKVPDDATAAQLAAALEIAASVADDMETELSGKKDAF